MTNSLFNSGETVAKTQNRPRAVAAEVEHWWQEMVSSTGSSNGGDSNQGSVSSEPRRRHHQGGQGRRGNGGSGKQQQQQQQQIQQQQQSQPQQQQPLPPQTPMGSRYKTEMCRQYIEKIKCAYGDKCQFAHGEQDLRPVFRHPKYKTEPCRSFNSAGYCPYGQRCHFVHKGDGYIQPASPASPPLSTSSSSGIGSDASLADLGLGMLDSMFTPPQSPEGRLPVFNRLSGSPPATGGGDVFAFHHVPGTTAVPTPRRLSDSEPDFGFYGF